MGEEERTYPKGHGKPTMAELACDFFTDDSPRGRSLLVDTLPRGPLPEERSPLWRLFGNDR